MILPGIHASVSGGLHRALEVLDSANLSCGQIFTSNQRRWKDREVRELEKEEFSRTPISVVSHASYLINLASSSSEVRERSFLALRQELMRMHQLGIRWTVLHPGAHMGEGAAGGIGAVAGAVRRILEDSPPGTGVLYENTAGQGTVIGSSFEQLAALLDGTGIPERTGICLDTCHAFAAGYDLSTVTAVDTLMEQFDSAVGLSRIEAFHMNDCLGTCGSHLDRHARLGGGLIGLEPLRYLASMEEFDGIPGIVETPGTDEDRIADASELTAAQPVSGE